MVNIEVPSLRQTLLQCLSQYGTSMLDSCSVTGSKLALFPSETQSHKTFVARSRPPLPTSRLPSLFPRKVRYNHPPALAPRAEPAGLEPKWLLSLKKAMVQRSAPVAHADHKRSDQSEACKHSKRIPMDVIGIVKNNTSAPCAGRGPPRPS